MLRTKLLFDRSAGFIGLIGAVGGLGHERQVTPPFKVTIAPWSQPRICRLESAGSIHVSWKSSPVLSPFCGRKVVPPSSE